MKKNKKTLLIAGLTWQQIQKQKQEQQARRALISWLTGGIINN